MNGLPGYAAVVAPFVLLLAVVATIAMYRAGRADALKDGIASLTGDVQSRPTAGRDHTPSESGTNDAPAASTGRIETAAASPSPVTDRDRVVSLLERNGGRMKQQQVVDRTGWSKSKVSRLLSSMEAADSITRVPLGREKVIYLQGSEPPAVGSTLSDPDDD